MCKHKERDVFVSVFVRGMSAGIQDYFGEDSNLGGAAVFFGCADLGLSLCVAQNNLGPFWGSPLHGHALKLHFSYDFGGSRMLSCLMSRSSAEKPRWVRTCIPSGAFIPECLSYSHAPAPMGDLYQGLCLHFSGCRSLGDGRRSAGVFCFDLSALYGY